MNLSKKKDRDVLIPKGSNRNSRRLGKKRSREGLPATPNVAAINSLSETESRNNKKG